MSKFAFPHWFATKIHYVVVHPTETAGEYSLFQGYGVGLIETVNVFFRIAELPLDLFDFLRESDELLASRMLGRGCLITPLQLDALEAFVDMNPLFACVVSHPATSDACADIVARASRPIHHVRLQVVPVTEASFTPIGSTLRLLEQIPEINLMEAEQADAALTYNAMREYVLTVLTSMEVDGAEAEQRDELASRIRTFQRKPVSLQSPLAVRGHFTTEPSETVLKALGYELPNGTPPGGDDADYIRAIDEVNAPLAALHDQVLSVSPAHQFLRPCDAVIAAPSILARWYYRSARSWRHRKRYLGEKQMVELIRAAADAIAQQSSYGTPALPVEFQEDNGRAGRIVLLHRRGEARAFAAQLALRASVDGVPVFRLSASPNLTRPILAKLSTASRVADKGNQRAKMNRFARQLSHELQLSVPSSFLTVAHKDRARLKLISDVPLEWTRLGRVPLMLRADCSRIPGTPGNVSFGDTIGGPEKQIPLSALRDVLVLRSFADNDPIRRMLWTTVRAFLDRARASMNVRLVDVSSLDDVMKALSNFQGALVVFDGHASPGTPTTFGTVIIGGKRVDLWALRGKVRVPPIVVLSACDTHSFESSHATPAQGLLTAGATTVVGTTLPVSAKYAAMFIARLLYRIDAYIPAATRGQPEMMRWSSVLPGLQRMTYVTEMLHAIDKKHGVRLTPEAEQAASFVGNLHINGFEPEEGERSFEGSRVKWATNRQIMAEESDWLHEQAQVPETLGVAPYPLWLEAVIRRLVISGVGPRAAVETAIEDWAWITDSLKYIELGNPERLLVVQD